MTGLVVDTDPGIDDALALLYLSSMEEVEIESITVAAGNSTQGNCLKNANYLTELADIESPVYRGSEKPLSRELETAESHGENGLGDLEVSEEYNYSNGNAVEAIIENANSDTDLLTLGPLTNIAKAVNRKQDVLSKYNSVTVMGGAINTFGNVNRVAEFNFWVDPKAANTVIQNSLQDTKIVPVNACREVQISRKKMKNLFDNSKYETIFKPYIRYYRENSIFEGAVMYDPLAAAISVNPKIADFRKTNAVVETKGTNTRGMLVTERRPQKQRKPNIRYPKNVDRNMTKEIYSQIQKTQIGKT
ncbi:MAG: hypothetical protein BRC29_03215 [Nanohaloarchaea archaeon SW_7_43_1]|nr:MAG: hypothetical protein BRC29_03215 [Nanohaloarchaea archaeon SW_7_43_1]